MLPDMKLSPASAVTNASSSPSSACASAALSATIGTMPGKTFTASAERPAAMTLSLKSR